MELDLFVGQFVLLGQTATTNLKSLSVSQQLILSGSLHQNMMPIEGSDFLALHDIVNLVKTQNLVASDALIFSTDTQSRVDIENIGQFLSLAQHVKLEAGGASSALALSQTVTVSASTHTSSLLTLSQSVVVGTITRNFFIEDVLGLNHGVSVYMPKRGFSTFITSIPSTPQNVRFLLSGVVDETFRPPLFGNQDELSFQRVNRRTRGGDLTIFRDTEWPMTETLRLNFDFPNQSDADRLIKVLRLTIGQYLQYTDHESQSWIGVVTNPNAPRVQAGRNTFSVEVILEVEKVPTFSAQITDELNLTQEVFNSTQFPQGLNLTQIAVCHVTRNLSASNELSIGQDGYRVFPGANTLVLTDFASWLNPLQSLDLIQEVDLSGTYNKTIEDDIDLVSFLPSYMVNNDPFMGTPLVLHQEVDVVLIRPNIHILEVNHELNLTQDATDIARLQFLSADFDLISSTESTYTGSFDLPVIQGDLIVIGIVSSVETNSIDDTTPPTPNAPAFSVSDSLGSSYTLGALNTDCVFTTFEGFTRKSVHLYYAFAESTGSLTFDLIMTNDPGSPDHYGEAASARVFIQQYCGLTTVGSNATKFVNISSGTDHAFNQSLPLANPNTLVVGVVYENAVGGSPNVQYDMSETYLTMSGAGTILVPTLIPTIIDALSISDIGYLMDTIGVLTKTPPPLDSGAHLVITGYELDADSENVVLAVIGFSP